MATSVADKRAAFRRLHEAGCFVLPNPWDLGSALLLQHLGFKALATTSAGMAWSMGRADGDVTLEQALHHFSQLARASDLPVNADFENAFGDAPDEVAKNVALAVDTGVAGLSVEDYSGSTLYEFDLAVARVAAARAALDRTGSGCTANWPCRRLHQGCAAPRRGDPAAEGVFSRGRRLPLRSWHPRGERDTRGRASGGAQAGQPSRDRGPCRNSGELGRAPDQRRRRIGGRRLRQPSTRQPTRSPRRAHSGDLPAHPAGGFSIRSFPADRFSLEPETLRRHVEAGLSRHAYARLCPPG